MSNEELEFKLAMIDEKIDSICDVIYEFNITIEDELNEILKDLNKMKSELIHEKD